jgi:hypothetical protein
MVFLQYVENLTSSLAKPILTDMVVNLPVGVIAVAVVYFFLPSKPKPPLRADKGQSTWKLIRRFDPIGTIIIIPCVICLLLALQWGGTKYPWGDGRVIALLVCFSVSFIAWIGVQVWEGDDATVPRNVAVQRTVACSSFYMLFGSAAFTATVYYVPIW